MTLNFMQNKNEHNCFILTANNYFTFFEIKINNNIFEANPTNIGYLCRSIILSVSRYFFFNSNIISQKHVIYLIY